MMNEPLKEIIISYFKGGNASGKSSGVLKMDLEVIENFYNKK